MGRRKPQGGEPNRWIAKSRTKPKPNFDAAIAFRETASIGLGLESTYKTERVRRDEVLKDQWTTYEGPDLVQQALYQAGWSLPSNEEQ